MPFQAVPNCYMLTIKALCESVEVVNTFYYTAASPISVTHLTQGITDWRARCESDWLACHPTDYQLVSYTARDLATSGGAEVTVSATQSGTNGTAGAMNASLALVRHSGSVGSAKRGWVEVGPVPAGAVSKGLVSSGYLTLVDNLMQDLLGPLPTNGDSPATASRTLHAAFKILSWVANDVLDSTYKRLLERGS